MPDDKPPMEIIHPYSDADDRGLIFHPHIPNLQVAWDATALGDLMTCPHKYELAHIHGWTQTGDKIDLEYGQASGHAKEVYLNEIVAGADHATALKRAIVTALSDTWRDGTPTLGAYVDVWRCTGEKPYKNEKGNRAKCPWSHKGKLFPAPGPATCGTCGSPTVHESRWFAEKSPKDRISLLREIVAWADDQPKGYSRPVLLDGKPMLEYNWRIEGPVVQGTQFYLVGNIDKVAQYGEPEQDAYEVYIDDYKTTKKSLDNDYFSQYSPNLQVDLYDMVAKVILPPQLAEHYTGVAIEASQILQGGVRFAMRTFTRETAQRVEMWREISIHLAEATQFAKMGYWPRRRSNCFLCQFKEVCSARPEDRERVLRANFIQSWWNPLTRQRQDHPGSLPLVTRVMGSQEIDPDAVKH